MLFPARRRQNVISFRWVHFSDDNWNLNHISCLEVVVELWRKYAEGEFWEQTQNFGLYSDG